MACFCSPGYLAPSPVTVITSITHARSNGHRLLENFDINKAEVEAVV